MEHFGYSKNNTLMNSPFSNSNKYAAAYVRWVRTDEPRTQRKPALDRIINPRQTVGPAYGKYATNRWSAESAANTPAAHGNKSTERRTCRALRALGARPVGHIANRSSERVGSMVGMGHLVQA